MCLHDVVIAFHFLLSFLLGGWHMNLAFAPSLFARFLKLSPSPKINTRCEKHFLAPARNFKSQRRRKIETFFMFFIIKKKYYTCWTCLCGGCCCSRMEARMSCRKGRLKKMKVSFPSLIVWFRGFHEKKREEKAKMKKGKKPNHMMNLSVGKSDVNWISIRADSEMIDEKPSHINHIDRRHQRKKE